MARIIDLDVAAPDDVEVVAHGETYLLPGDIPVPDYLAIVKASEALDEAEGEGALEAAERLYERVLDLFRVRQPDMDRLPVGMGQLVRLIQSLYGVEPDPQTPSRQAGTRSGTRARKTKAKASGS